ncbi:MAG TPA: helix-turn-helix domain-containing protein [Solirubrobacteraceae bacterium]
MSNELAVLQAVRLKGRPGPADVAAATGLPESEALGVLGTLVEAGTSKELNGRFMLTPEGREHLNALIAAERESVDQDALRAAYEEFDEHNTALKQVVTAWQMRDGEPNDHTDATYDAGVVEQLAALHERFAPLVDRMVAAAPRLAPYPARFANAIAQVQAGDHSFIARPIADSYHTVWFELHEDLIGLLGLSRQEEAASGRAE